MPRVIGIDPGTVSIDVCGLLDGELSVDESWSTADALADPEGFTRAIVAAGPLDLVVAPSGYGLPLQAASQTTDDDLRLAFLSPRGETGGIGGLRRLVRQLTGAGVPLMFVPGVLHLDTVPAHRKINRVDLGTADKLCAAALGAWDHCRYRHQPIERAAFILLELGGAFTAAVAVQHGQVVDGIGGTSGPIGWRAAGALDGEVAYLAGEITKAALFQGGVESIGTARPMALDAYIEGAAKAVRALQVAAPVADEVLLSGRLANDPVVCERLTALLGPTMPVRPLVGFARVAKQGAQGAALLADGLAGGEQRRLVERLRIREAGGTVLDHLYVTSRIAARRRLGLPDA